MKKKVLIVSTLETKELSALLEQQKNDPRVEVFHCFFKGEESVEIMREMNGIIFYNNIDSRQISATKKMLLDEIKTVRVSPFNEHGFDVEGVNTRFSLESAFGHMKELLLVVSEA